MLISEMHTEIKIGVDKTDSLNYPDLLPEEIDVFINKNIEKFISQRAYGTNPKQEGLESTQKRFDDLLTLISNSNISNFTTSSQTKPFGYIVPLPSGYWHAIEEEVNVTYLDCNNVSITARVPVYPVMHDQYNKIIRDPFNKPDKTGVVRMGLSGNIEIISSSGVVPTTYFLRYIRKPAVVKYGTTYTPASTDINCDLPEHTHKEIIQMVVVDILGNIEQLRRLPVETQQLNTVE